MAFKEFERRFDVLLKKTRDEQQGMGVLDAMGKSLSLALSDPGTRDEGEQAVAEAEERTAAEAEGELEAARRDHEEELAALQEELQALGVQLRT